MTEGPGLEEPVLAGPGLAGPGLAGPGLAGPGLAGTVPWPDELARRYAKAGWWRGQALGTEFAVVAAARPDATALVDGATRVSYGSLLARADALAGRLARLGMRPGMRIVVQLPNCWQFVVLTLACLRAGIVPVMALPAHRRHELAYLCEHSEARALAVPDVLRGFDHQQMAEELVPEPGLQISLGAIRDGLAAAGVARFKWPERLEIVAELPVTKVGKLDKKALRDLLRSSTP